MIILYRLSILFYGQATSVTFSQVILIITHILSIFSKFHLYNRVSICDYLLLIQKWQVVSIFYIITIKLIWWHFLISIISIINWAYEWNWSFVHVSSLVVNIIFGKCTFRNFSYRGNNLAPWRWSMHQKLMAIMIRVWFQVILGFQFVYFTLSIINCFIECFECLVVHVL